MEIDITQRKNQFAGIPIPDFIDMILGGDERADEAIYEVRWHILETDKAYTPVFPMISSIGLMALSVRKIFLAFRIS